MNAPRPDHAAHLRRAVTDVASVVATLQLGEGAKRQPGGAVVRCPWHAEKTASCSITNGPDGTIRARCFGCDASGDLLSLAAAVYGLDMRGGFPETLRRVAEDFRLWSVVLELTKERPSGNGLQMAPRATCNGFKSTPPPPPLPVVDPAIYDALTSALLERCPIGDEPDARAYLEARGVFADAEARGFGALPSSKGAQLEALAPLAREFGADTLVRAGLVKAAPGGVWAPAHRLLIPWRDRNGRILSVQRRLIGPSSKDGPPKYLFPRGLAMPGEPFGADTFEGAFELLKHRRSPIEVAFVESAIDALAMTALARRHGAPRIALGLPSASTWRSEWARFATGLRAIVATDADAAGEKVALRIIEDCKAAGAASIARRTPTCGKDWGDVADA